MNTEQVPGLAPPDFDKSLEVLFGHAQLTADAVNPQLALIDLPPHGLDRDPQALRDVGHREQLRRTGLLRRYGAGSALLTGLSLGCRPSSSAISALDSTGWGGWLRWRGWARHHAPPAIGRSGEVKLPKAALQSLRWAGLRNTGFTFMGGPFNWSPHGCGEGQPVTGTPHRCPPASHLRIIAFVSRVLDEVDETDLAVAAAR